MCWIWDIVNWISHKNPVLWVSDNTSKLQKTVRSRLCEVVMSQSENCVMLWDLGEVITMMSLWGQCDLSVWGHCELIQWPLHPVCVRSHKLLIGMIASNATVLTAPLNILAHLRRDVINITTIRQCTLRAPALQQKRPYTSLSPGILDIRSFGLSTCVFVVYIFVCFVC